MSIAPTLACELPASDTPLEELTERATAAREALGERLIVLGHHYQKDEVIRFADVTGDSYLLAKRGAEAVRADLVLFCGVYFMAEAADVLWVTEQVLLDRLDRKHLHPAEVSIIMSRVQRLEAGA